MVLKRKLPSRVQSEQSAPAVMPPAAPSTQAVSLPDDTAPVFAPEANLTFAETDDAALSGTDEPSNTAYVSNPDTLAPSIQESLEPSFPTENSLKRKMRAKTPRSFSSTVPDVAAAPAAPTMAANIPQTNVDFEHVGQRLAQMGAVAATHDSLTQAAAPAAAEAATPVPPPAVPDMDALVAMVPESKPAAKTPQPDWLAELTKELEAAMPKERDAKRDRLGLPPPPTLPSNLLSGLVVDDGPGATPPEPAKPEPMGASQSDVPWAAPAVPKDGWSLDLPADKEASALPPSPSQPADIYANVGQAESAPPWQKSGLGPAELPGSRAAMPMAPQGTPMLKMGMTAAILLAVVAGGWWAISRGDKTQEQLARLTGSLREVTEKLPTDGTTGLQPEQTIASNPNLLPPPDATAEANKSIIDFADVPNAQANQPIVADGTEQVPEDIGFVASLQKAIAEKKAERLETTPNGEQIPTTGNAALDKTIRNNALKAQLDAELAAYRKALVEASSVAEAPRPGEFLGGQTQPAKPYMNAAETAAAEPATDSEGALLPPPAPQTASRDSVPAAASYGNNPNNLPILPEPTTETAKVRTLADFDVAMFEPEQEKVRIPKGIRPRMSTSDFPEMEVLSLVPNKGLVAYKNGTEGVLLIGETVDGWQLVQVGADSAEFKNGGRSYYVSAD
ncbi:MAG: hypothetical protein WAZ18_00370 [Alphaproteobacteria bacterium]